MDPPLATVDRSRPVAQRRSSLIRSSTDITDRVNLERSSRIEIESCPKTSHANNTKHIKLVVRGINGTNKVSNNHSTADETTSNSKALSSKEQEINLTTLIDEYQVSLNRSDCENSSCNRFKLLSYKISQTLLERINAIKSELRTAKSNMNNNNNNTIDNNAPKATIEELDEASMYGQLNEPSRESKIEAKREKEKLTILISERTKRIQELEKLVEDQRKLRLQDASQVEEKAARIKEWVANKLRELEDQNKQLRDQNRKQKENIESLKLQTAKMNSQVSPLRLKTNSRLDSCDSIAIEPKQQAKLSPLNEPGRESPIYDSVTMELTSRHRKELEEEKPPPPPLHQTDRWETELYQLAEEAFTKLVHNHATSAHDNWQQENDRSLTSNELIANLVKPSFTTIYGDQVVEGISDENLGDATSQHHNDFGENLSRRVSGDHHSQTSSLSDRQRKSSIECSSEIEVPSTPIRRLFDSPMRSRSGTDCILRTQSVRRSPAPEKLHDFLVADLIKRGYLVKPGALKSHNRWFVLKNFHLYSYKSESEEIAKSAPLAKMKLNPNCQIMLAQQSGESSFPFKVVYPDKTIQLVASSGPIRDDWIRMLTVTVNISDIEPDQLNKHNATYEGLLSVTRQGNSKRCFAILINHVVFFLRSLTDPTPMSYLSVKNSRIREITDSSDYDPGDTNSILKQKGISQDCSLAIYPRFATSPDPVYITLGSRNETDKWFHHLSVASGLDQSYGTPFERTLTKLMLNNSMVGTTIQRDLESSNCLWRDNPVMIYTDRPITSPLTTLPNETLRSEAIEMFRSILLFTQVPLEPIAVDYHVSLLQNCLDRFLKNSELRNEFYAQLIKQSTYIVHKTTDEDDVLDCNGSAKGESQRRCHKDMECHLLTRLDTLKSGTSHHTPNRIRSHASTISSGKSGEDRSELEQEHYSPPTQSALLQVMQILAIAVSLNLPRGRMRWWLTDHLLKFASPDTEIGKYALYNLKAIDRSTANGTRENIPSRTEIMGILLRNPYNHSTPHSIPVSFSDSSYLVIETDGSTTVEEFMDSISKVLDIRNSSLSDFFLFADDPCDSRELHILEPQRKVLDVVGWWEQSFRRNNSGRFESTKVIKLSCKKRLVFRTEESETYQERLLILHQMNQEIVTQRVPLDNQLAIELAAVMVQLTYGDFDKSKDGRLLERILDRARSNYLPRYFAQHPDDQWKETVTILTDRWQRLTCRSPQDCVRVYLNCFRRIKFNND